MKRFGTIISLLFLLGVGTVFASGTANTGHTKKPKEVLFQTITPVVTDPTIGNATSAAAMIHVANGSALQGIKQASSVSNAVSLRLIKPHK